MVELRQCFDSVKFQITPEEVAQIFKDFGGNKTGYITFDDFSQRLSCWKEGGLKQAEAKQTQKRIPHEDP